MFGFVFECFVEIDVVLVEVNCFGNVVVGVDYGCVVV